MKKAFLGAAILVLLFVGCDSGGLPPSQNSRCRGCHLAMCEEITITSGVVR